MYTAPYMSLAMLRHRIGYIVLLLLFIYLFIYYYYYYTLFRRVNSINYSIIKNFELQTL